MSFISKFLNKLHFIGIALLVAGIALPYNFLKHALANGETLAISHIIQAACLGLNLAGLIYFALLRQLRADHNRTVDVLIDHNQALLALNKAKLEDIREIAEVIKRKRALRSEDE